MEDEEPTDKSAALVQSPVSMSAAIISNSGGNLVFGVRGSRF